MSARACHNADSRFSIREARSIVRDLFEPSPAIYWTDFLLSMAVGGGCFFVSRRLPVFSVPQVLFAFAACLAYYRAALFIHELIHLREGSFRAFRIVWNVLCGIPFLMPSFLYYTHLAHHARKHYGTPDDGEYLPLATQPRGEILKYLLQPFIIPLLAVVRFLLLTPLAWVSPRLRRLIHQRASSMVMDPAYVRPLPTKREWRIWRLQETGCFLFVFAAAVLFIRGRLPIDLLVQTYMTAVVILILNHVRTLGAHRFRHRGESLTFVDQLLDSVNYPRHPLTGELWAPVGLRFHALHHLFPSLPYHALGKAHRRLMAELPADSPYRRTESPSLVASIAELWQAAGVVEQENRQRAPSIPHRRTFDRSHV
ncbi:MAG TPA: fatty acid desaturase [Verrucomicrobiae bacterium]|nr:fatty acid desaturase [Verrucomicrobiae bacterium]HWB11476.1 fatty acid desaturase [Pirellulales bacterium]